LAGREVGHVKSNEYFRALAPIGEELTRKAEATRRRQSG
jgi:hypothetical protein